MAPSPMLKPATENKAGSGTVEEQAVKEYQRAGRSVVIQSYIGLISCNGKFVCFITKLETSHWLQGISIFHSNVNLRPNLPTPGLHGHKRLKSVSNIGDLVGLKGRA